MQIRYANIKEPAENKDFWLNKYAGKVHPFEVIEKGDRFFGETYWQVVNDLFDVTLVSERMLAFIEKPDKIFYQ